MARTSPRQRKTTGRVMHEFKHGELKSGPRGRGGRVKNRRQAIAIALKEAGASKTESKGGNRRNLAKTKRKEARGQTAQQRKEGKSRVGASGSRKSTSNRSAAARRSSSSTRRASTRTRRTTAAARKSAKSRSRR
jgi:hypothetical protein